MQGVFVLHENDAYKKIDFSHTYGQIMMAAYIYLRIPLKFHD